MSESNNGVIIAGLIVAYLYMKKKQATAGAVVAIKAPATMPASVGSGTKQMAVGALAGLLQSLANGPANNTSQAYFSNTPLPDTSSVVQEAAIPPDLAGLGASDELAWYA